MHLMKCLPLTRTRAAPAGYHVTRVLRPPCRPLRRRKGVTVSLRQVRRSILMMHRPPPRKTIMICPRHAQTQSSGRFRRAAQSPTFAVTRRVCIRSFGRSSYPRNVRLCLIRLRNHGKYRCPTSRLGAHCRSSAESNELCSHRPTCMRSKCVLLQSSHI